MKDRLLRYLMGVILPLHLLCACGGGSDEPFPTPVPEPAPTPHPNVMPTLKLEHNFGNNEVYFRSGSTTYDIKVCASASWTLSVTFEGEEGWLVPSLQQGDEGQTSVVCTISDNFSESNRRCKLRVDCGPAFVTIDFTQSSASLFTKISGSKMTVDKKGGDYKIPDLFSFPYTVICDASWLHFTPSEDGNHPYTFSADKNSTGKSREAKVYVKSDENIYYFWMTQDFYLDDISISKDNSIDDLVNKEW